MLPSKDPQCFVRALNPNVVLYRLYGVHIGTVYHCLRQYYYAVGCMSSFNVGLQDVLREECHHEGRKVTDQLPGL